MKTTVNAAARAHLSRETTTLAVCWLIEKNDGTHIRGTDHDEDIEVASGDYAGVYGAGNNISASDIRSTSDASVDNTEVTGAFRENGAVTTLTDVTVADIEGGLLSHAPVTLFICNWESPDDFQIIVKYGYLGEIPRDSDGRYTTELRGLKQLLTQTFVRTYAPRCQVVRLGDSECGLNLDGITLSGTVSAVAGRGQFTIGSLGSPSPDEALFRGGELRFTSGANAGYTREIKRNVGGALTFWERFPVEPSIGDAFTVIEGCDRTFSRCQQLGNQLNFRGYGIFIEGIDPMMRGPT